MKVVVLGTGAADGIPAPFCHCATCTEARATGTVRAPGGVLIDQELLIDAPPALGAAAARAGVDLTAVHTMAITHAHSDHWDPAILLHRSWQNGAGRLRLIGPPAVVTSARQWLAADAEVELIVAQPGGVLDLGRHMLRVLPSTHGQVSAGQAIDPWAAEAVLYEVISDDAALLYAADTALPDEVMLAAVADAQYDVALVELTFGRGEPTTAGHLDHASFPAALAALRDVGAIGPATDVLAIHLSHHNPPMAHLHSQLAAWGARAVADGSHLHYAADSTGVAARRPPRTVLVTGGARSGKSSFAEAQAAAATGPVTYLATGWPAGQDAEWNRRIAAHAARRPAHWRTVETADAAASLADVPDGATVVLDCLATWLTRQIDDAEAWADPDGAAHTVVLEATSRLTAALRSCRAAQVYIVTNEVGSGVVPAHSSGRLFRDLLGTVNRTVAAICDEVVLVVAGRPLALGPQAGPATPPTWEAVAG